MDRIGIGAGPILTGISQSDNSRIGLQSVAEFEGSLDECNLKRLQLEQLGAADVDIRSKGNGYYILLAQFPFGFDGSITTYGIVPSIHELEMCIAQTSVYRSPKLRLYLKPSHIGIVWQVVADYQSRSKYPTVAGHTALADAEADIDSQITLDGTLVGGRSLAQTKADAHSLFEAVALIGQEDFIEYYTVYRRTLTAATPQQVRASYTGVGKIWTTAEVQAFENIDPQGWFVLDSGAQWLKSRPQVVAVAGQKTQVIYSYTECLTAFGMVYDAYNAATLVYAPAP